MLERSGDPRALVRVGRAWLGALVHEVLRGYHGVERVEGWPAAARAALELYDDDPAVAFADLAAEPGCCGGAGRARDAHPLTSTFLERTTGFEPATLTLATLFVD